MPKLDPADYPDAAVISEVSDRSLHETMRMLAMQELFGPRLAAAHREYPATYAQAALMPGEGAYLVFTTGHSAEQLEQAEDSARQDLRITFGDDAHLVEFVRDPDQQPYTAQ